MTNHSPEKVGDAIARFLDDLRERQSLDAEPEFADLCGSCLRYNVALHGLCFGCLSKGKLPS